METKFNFKSQVCTSIEQSRRLLELGLKKETADMAHEYQHSSDDYKLSATEFSIVMHLQEQINKRLMFGYSGDDLFGKHIPAWSLHRLLSLIEYDDGFVDVSLREGRYGIHYGYDDGWYDNLYDAVISCIEALIEEKEFNKEYLEE